MVCVCVCMCVGNCTQLKLANLVDHQEGHKSVVWARNNSSVKIDMLYLGGERFYKKITNGIDETITYHGITVVVAAMTLDFTGTQ